MRTVLRGRNSIKTVSYEEQIISQDKYASRFSHQMEATVFIFPAIFPEKPKVTCSVALGLAFLSAENGNRQQEDLSLIDFGLLSERVLSVRTKSINKNFFN